MFEEQSAFDVTKAIATLNRIYSYPSPEIKRDFTVSAVDVNTGEYVAMDQTNTTFENLAQSAMSSASIPVVFPPQSLGSHVFMDGGTVWNLNLDSAVQQCLNKGFDASDIIADIAICGYNSIPEDALDVEKKAYVNWQ